MIDSSSSDWIGHHQPRTGAQPAAQDGAEPEHVDEGQGAEHRRVGVDHAGELGVGRLGQQRPMAEHDQARLSRRAGGAQQHGQRFGSGGDTTGL